MQVSQGRREISKARVRATGVAALTALALVALPGVASADPEVLQSNDQLGLRFEKSSTPQPEGATTTVTVRTGDGKWAIWHAVGSNPKLSRVGVVDGHPESAGPGLIKADTEQGTVFYVIKGNALAPAPAPAA